MFKEFFTELCKEVFDTDRGLWLATTKNELYPNPIGFATERQSVIMPKGLVINLIRSSQLELVSIHW